MAIKTTDGKRGGNLVGKPHNDKKGRPVGGIKAVVTDNNGQPVELEGGEVIINKAASKKHWKKLSEINQSAGGGVPIGPPIDPHEADPDEYKKGGKIEFNPNKIPNKWILKYAENIKENHPEIWKMGGNIFGNQAFKNLKRVAERGYWLDSERWMMIKWRAFVARHKKDFRIAGVVAMLKWVDKVDRGWPYMKNLIEAEIKKKEEKKKPKMAKGGVVTYRDKYNKKYGYPKNSSHSLSDIAKKTGVSKKGIQEIYNKGIGAYKTNPGSVRPNVKSKEQWAYARVYSAVMGGKAADVDAKELKMDKGGQFKTIKRKDGTEYDVKIYSEQELEMRAEKKKGNLHNIANQISRLRSNLNKDLNSDSEKTALTALSILLMLETSERVGNETSAENGHVGITGLTKDQVKITGTNTNLSYTGKSGVDHDKSVSSEKIANALKKAKSNSPGKFIFETSDGFKVKNDTVNRYLSTYDVTAKDIRGFSANKWISTKLKQIKPGETETARKKQFREIVKTVAEKVGHGAATLKKHYLLPDLESTFIEKSKVLDLKEIKMKKGGMTKSRKKKFDEVMDEFKDGELRSGSKTGPVVKNPKQAVAIAYSESKKYILGGRLAEDIVQSQVKKIPFTSDSYNQGKLQALRSIKTQTMTHVELPLKAKNYKQIFDFKPGVQNANTNLEDTKDFKKYLAYQLTHGTKAFRGTFEGLMFGEYVEWTDPKVDGDIKYFNQVLGFDIILIAKGKFFINFWGDETVTGQQRFRSLYKQPTSKQAQLIDIVDIDKRTFAKALKKAEDYDGLSYALWDDEMMGFDFLESPRTIKDRLTCFADGVCTPLQLAGFLMGSPLKLKRANKTQFEITLIPFTSKPKRKRKTIKATIKEPKEPTPKAPAKPKVREPFPKLKKPKFKEGLNYLEFFKTSLPKDAVTESNKDIANNIKRMYNAMFK